MTHKKVNQSEMFSFYKEGWTGELSRFPTARDLEATLLQKLLKAFLGKGGS